MRAPVVRRLLLLAPALAVALLTSSVAAKDDTAATAGSTPIRYARTYAAAMAESRDRGCVVFATFHGDG